MICVHMVRSGGGDEVTTCKEYYPSLFAVAILTPRGKGAETSRGPAVYPKNHVSKLNPTLRQLNVPAAVAAASHSRGFRSWLVTR